MPVLLVFTIGLSFTYNKQATMSFITNEKQLNNATTIVTSLNETQVAEIKQQLMLSDSAAFTAVEMDIEKYLSSLNETVYAATIVNMHIADDLKFESGWRLFKHKIPMWVFIFISFGLTVWAFRKNLSLIPMLGLVCCLYMMAELGLSNWIGFGVWLLIGLLIYFSYGYRKSKLIGVATDVQ
jgi:APA family basic amino acid/polyamine antiporter